MVTMFSAIAALASVLLVSCVFKFIHGLKAVSFLPGLRIPFVPFTLVGIVVPGTWWNPGMQFTWTWRKTKNVYCHYGCDTVSMVPFISGSPTLYTRSMKVAKQVVVDGQRSGAFGKSDDLNSFFLLWGPSVIGADGELWRRHRRIASPAFNNETYAFVWNASRDLYAEMASAEGWATKNVVEIPSANVLTLKFTLIIFASVGFGFPFTWTNPPAREGEMGVQECLEIIKETNIFATAAPAWAWKLPLKWVRRTCRAYETMRAFMHTLVGTMRETVRSKAEDANPKRGRDLLTLLIRASEDAGGKMALDDNEVIGNVFSFMFAGHDTTSHTLAATLAFLALNPDLQEELAAQVQEVTQGRSDGTLLLEDYGKLDKVLAAYYEGIRLFPSVLFLVREAMHDAILDVSDGDEPKVLSIKKGTHVLVDMVGIQYNQRYFSEPEEFRPSRWYREQRNSDETDELEEYTAFSIGPRACLGRRFATAEGVCFLASLLQEWRIEPLFAVQSDGRDETVEEWRERVMQAKVELTMGIRDVPIRLVRRT